MEFSKVERPRGATDLVNCLLNYGYAILYTCVQGAIIRAGLDPFAGFLHVDRPGRASLVLDFMEEFRQQVVDRTVFSMINQGTSLEIEEGKLSDDTRKNLEIKFINGLKHMSIMKLKNIDSGWLYSVRPGILQHS